MLRVLLTVGICFPVLGGLLAWQGFKERDVARVSSQTPETMTLNQLIARGPNGNANVLVTDFVMVRTQYVERGRRNRWNGAWVPIVPKDPAAPGGKGGSPTALKVIVYSSKGSNPEEVYQRVSTPQLAGLVINNIKTPNDSARSHFQEQYPQTDFSNCIFIEEGREPASEGLAALMIYGGIAAVVIGIGSLGLALLVWRKNAAASARQTKGRKKRASRDDNEDDDRPRKRRSSARGEDDDEPPRKRRALADDDEDEKPRRKRLPVDDDEKKPSRRKPAARGDDVDRPRRRRPADDDEDDRPRKKPRRDRDD